MPPNTAALLDAPLAATLTVYRSDGSILTSPVWFRAVGDSIELVVAEGDPKLARLGADPRCVFMAFETDPPFGGVRIVADAELATDGVAEARLAIASRYLGAEIGRRYVAERTKPGVIVRLPLASASTWDLASILPKQSFGIRN